MRLLRWSAVFVTMLLPVMTVAAQTQAGQGGGAPQAGVPSTNSLIMTVAGFADGSDIPPKYTAAGDRMSPAITWSNAPAGTVSFLVHMHEMENSRNHTTEDQLHWLVWNIPGTATGLPEGIPKGAQLENGAYQISASGLFYRAPGAAATSPRRHYAFELFALDTKIDVPPGTDPFETLANVMKAAQGHVLSRAVYIGLFHQPR